MTTSDFIEWATTWAPDPNPERAPFREAIATYDDVDDRLGDVAEGDDFLTRAMWMEAAIRLARIGWKIREVEDLRWPLSGGSARVADLLATRAG